MMHGRGLNHRTDRIEETAGRRRGKSVPRVLGDASSHVLGSPASSKVRAPTCWRTWRWSGCSSPMVRDVNAQDVNACGVFWFYAFISEKPEFFLNLGHPRGCPTNKNLENIFFGGRGQGMIPAPRCLALSPMTAFQSARWHSREQYRTASHRAHTVLATSDAHPTDAAVSPVRA